MTWIDGPLNEQTVLWFGVKVFWWKRAVNVAQIVLGSAVLLPLLSQTQKAKMHAVLAEANRRATGIAVPPVVRLRTILKWIVPIILAVAGIIAALATVQTRSGQPVPATSVFLIASFFLAMATIPIVALVTSASMLLTTFRAGQRYVPPMLAWLTHHERIERSLVVVPFILLLLVSLVGLYLS